MRDGVDGFRIPTFMPQAGSGLDLAQRYANGTDSSDFHFGLASQFVALDANALDDALKKLITDPALRRSMGEAGRRHARTEYDWAVIYRRYQALWDDLAERRRADPDLHPPVRMTERPDRPDPFAAFAGYATAHLGQEHLVTLRNEASALTLRRSLKLNDFAQTLQPGADECSTIVGFLTKQGPQTVSKIAGLFPGTPAWQVQRNLIWLAKMEVLQIDAP